VSIPQTVGSAAARIGKYGLTNLLLGLILLVPAFYNRFPLLFPDTDEYLSVSYGLVWTADRPGFYGLLYRPILNSTPGILGLWLVAALQATIIASLLLVVARFTAPKASQLQLLGVSAVTALCTSLPWHAAQLMPDAFTGILVLTAWVASSRRSNAPGNPLLWLTVGVLSLMHYTHLPLTIIATCAAVAFAAVGGTAMKEVGRRALIAFVIVSAVVGAHVAANQAAFGRASVSPMGSLFLFARLNEDGLIPLWLDEHCGRDAPRELCDIRGSLPRDSQLLLWSPDSSFLNHTLAKPGTPEFWHWVDVLAPATMGSIAEHPLQFLAAAAGSGARQFVHFDVLDDLCPASCDNPTVIRFRPDAGAAINNSRQLRDELPKPLIRTVINRVEWVGLLLLAPVLLIAIRRGDARAQSLVATVAACVIANAFVSAALSAVNDRYQSRILWIVIFAELAVFVRWRNERRPSITQGRTNDSRLKF
jgi:hypothetical protein